MRLVVAGFAHETNQQLPTHTQRGAFKISYGDDVLHTNRGRTPIGGMLDAANRLGIEIVGAFHASALPSGPITADTFAFLKGELLNAVAALLPADAIVLDLHGAGAVVGIDDLEGELCKDLRTLAGPTIRIGAAHDLHGHVTHTEVEALDVVVSVEQYPHDDLFETGQRAVELIASVVQERIDPVTHLEILPMLMPTTTTYHGVGGDIVELARSMESHPRVLHCRVMHGFPYSDTPLAGTRVVVMTDGDRDLAQSVAREVASQLWAWRHRFSPSYPDAEEAVRCAIDSSTDGLILINETSDNPGGGAPGDGTHLLRALIEAEPQDAVFCGLFDPAAALAAAKAGPGATIEVSLGGRFDALGGAPLQCSAYVRSVTDGWIVLESAMGRGAPYSLGLSARLIVGGVDVIVTSVAIQTIDRTPMLLHGIDPTTRRIVAIKSSQHFRAYFRDIAAEIITADPPGWTSARLDHFDYARVPRPIFPLDPDATWKGF